MQKVTNAYATQIKKIPFRNRSFATVIVGVINKEAQKQVKFTDNTPLLFYSNKTSPFGDGEVEIQYATYEKNFFRVDSNMCYTGRTQYIDNGVISEDIDGSITLDLGAEYNLAGLTVDFGNKYPIRFNLVLDNEIRLILNDKKVWIYTESFTTRYITFVPKAFINSTSARFRIERFKCGYYKEFTNNQILNIDYTEIVSPISEELSQNNLTVKVENFGRKYDVEKEDDLTRFFIVGQDINVEFGYQLDDTSIEYLDLGNMSLNEWEIDSQTLLLKGTSYINTLDDTCLIGEYSANGKTLYALAEEVFEDLGLEEKEYHIDERLKHYTTHNPLPVLPHSQLLQIISNAGQCSLIRGREGQYRIIPTAFLDKEDLIFTVVGAHTEASTPEKIINLENSATTNYIADYSQDYFRVDGKMYWSTNDNQGYISQRVSDEYGKFGLPPTITITTNKPIQITGWTIDFVGAIPEIIDVISYYNDEQVYSNRFEVTSREFSFQGDFGYCDKTLITIPKGAPNARVHIASIKTPPIIFTFTTERDVVGSSKARIDELVKNVELETTTYTPSEDKAEAYKTTFKIENGYDYSNWDIQFSSCIIPNAITVNGNTTTPIALTGQHCIVDLSSYAVETEITLIVSGKQLTTTAKSYRRNINEKGITNSYQNPLVDNDEWAQDNLKWLGVYNKNNKHYTIPNRGYPELEVGDIVGLEIPQLDSLAAVRLTEHKISFSGGGLSGTDYGLRENITYFNKPPVPIKNKWSDVAQIGKWSDVKEIGTWETILNKRIE